MAAKRHQHPGGSLSKLGAHMRAPACSEVPACPQVVMRGKQAVFAISLDCNMYLSDIFP